MAKMIDSLYTKEVTAVLNLLKHVTLETVVGTGLVLALFFSIFMEMDELSMSIASGLVGYIGHGKVQHYDERKEE